jgi:hypothetical protein
MRCLLQHVIEGKIEGMIQVKRRRGRRIKLLLDDLIEKRGNWKSEKEAQGRILWRTGFRRGCEPVV